MIKPAEDEIVVVDLHSWSFCCSPSCPHCSLEIVVAAVCRPSRNSCSTQNCHLHDCFDSVGKIKENIKKIDGKQEQKRGKSL